MRTFSGEEAIEIAQQHNLTLYDVGDKADVTVAEALGLIENGRNARSFVLKHWPETEEEAERLVLSACYELLENYQLSDIRMTDLAENEAHPFPMHLKAAELAAQSLVEQHKLELKEKNRDRNVYHIPATWYLNQSFLQSIEGIVCEDCAKLNLSGAFHESCLRALLDYLNESPLRLDEIAEYRAPKVDNHRVSKMLPGLEIPWLQKTASMTKERWMNVIRPRFVKDYTESDGTNANQAPPAQSEIRPSIQPRTTEHPETLRVELQDATAERVAREIAAASTAGTEYTRARAKVTKENLITNLVHYLRSVEILDENGELARLQMERTKLLDQISAQEREFEELKRQRGFLESQCDEMQRDLDTLLQAMQVAKRRTSQNSRLVDAPPELEGEFE